MIFPTGVANEELRAPVFGLLELEVGNATPDTGEGDAGGEGEGGEGDGWGKGVVREVGAKFQGLRRFGFSLQSVGVRS